MLLHNDFTVWKFSYNCKGILLLKAYPKRRLGSFTNRLVHTFGGEQGYTPPIMTLSAAPRVADRPNNQLFANIRARWLCAPQREQRRDRKLRAVLCEALRRLFVTFVVSQRTYLAVTLCRLDLDEPTLRAPAGTSEFATSGSHSAAARISFHAFGVTA